MPTIDLPPAWLAEVHRILSLHAPQAEVWAYGSRVAGGGHDASDLDLVLRNPADPEKPVSGLGALRATFEDSRLPIVVEVQDWSRLPDSFRQEIRSCHVVMRPPD